MDPLTALSVAGTVIQFVDFGSKLLSGSVDAVELFKSSTGSLKPIHELQVVSSNLSSVIVKLRQATQISFSEIGRPLAEDDQRQESSFLAICDEAGDIATEILDKLDGLRIKKGKKSGKHKAWESLKAALNTALSKKEIDSLRQRLATLQSSLQSGTMLLMIQKINVQTVHSSNRFDSLDAKTQQILTALSSTKDTTHEDVINSISKLLCRVEKVLQDEHLETRRMILGRRGKKRKTNESTVDTITAEIEMLDVTDLDEQILRTSVNRMLLEDLSYPEMTDRYEGILQAYPSTFEWVFSDTAHWELPWSDFGKWLREEKGIYWINGKAGSGKSTLVKHIYDDARTKTYLQRWNPDGPCGQLPSNPCSVATFFFWNSGTSMQKSQQGLLRSLLFQVLRAHTDLIPVVLPFQWAGFYNKTLNHDVAQRIYAWSLPELHEAFERLIKQGHYPLRLCFFVDGLDEFDGDMEQLCVLFHRLSRMSKNAKFCLSSRPWIQFQQALQECPQLKLQDLTSKDISTYVNGKFKDSPAFIRLAAKDEMLVSSLALEIKDRAEGVFLWVQIVVILLLKGVNNRDTIPQLWTRLRSFPRELNPLYDSMLSQIEPLYLEWAARAFSIMRVSTELSSDPFQKQSQLSQQLKIQQDGNGKEGLGAITLIEFLYAFKEDYDLSDPTTLPEIFDDIRIHITARCSGLLEISRPKGRHTDPSDGGSCASQHVRWMHRTTRDFMNEDEKWMKILDEALPPEHSAHATLMRSCIMALTTHLRPRTKELAHSDKYHGWANNLWIHAYHANGHAPTRKERTSLLNTLLGIMAPGPYLHLFPNNKQDFLRRATMYCLSDYVEDTLSGKAREIQRDTANSLLNRLCDHMFLASKDFPFPTAKMVDYLLKMCDPFSEPPKFRMRGLTIRPLEISRFLESLLAVFETFANAEVDPTATLGYVPKGFVFHKKFLRTLVEESIEPTCEDLGLVLDKLEVVIRANIEGQANDSEPCGKKRKIFEEVLDGSTTILDDSNPKDAVYTEGRVPNSAKRVKFAEEHPFRFGIR